MVSPTQLCWRYHSLPLRQRYDAIVVERAWTDERHHACQFQLSVCCSLVFYIIEEQPMLVLYIPHSCHYFVFHILKLYNNENIPICLQNFIMFISGDLCMRIREQIESLEEAVCSEVGVFRLQNSNILLQNGCELREASCVGVHGDTAMRDVVKHIHTDEEFPQKKGPVSNVSHFNSLPPGRF